MSCNFLLHLKSVFQPPIDEEESEEEQDYFEDCKQELITYQLLNKTYEDQQLIKSWLGTAVSKNKRKWLFEQYLAFTERKIVNLKEVIFTLIPGFESFILKFNYEAWEAEDFQYFFDMLASITLSLGYENTLSDLKMTRENNRIHTVQRYQLKPLATLPLVNGKIDQRYGNILICLNLENEKLCNIKFSTVSKRCSDYTPALSIKSLLEAIAQAV